MAEKTLKASLEIQSYCSSSENLWRSATSNASWHHHINLFIIPTPLFALWIDPFYWIIWGVQKIRIDAMCKKKEILFLKPGNMNG
jgi:hypothetical protein